MSSIVGSIASNEQLGKAFYELLQQLGSCSVQSHQKPDNLLKNFSHSSECKSVPLLQNTENTEQLFLPKIPLSEDEKFELQTSMKTNAVDSTLGRPRYQWEQSKTDTSSRRLNSKEKNELFSVYVGNIPVDITKYELDDLFCDAGEVVDSFVVSPTNGHSNTYGFVRFRTLKEAYEAVEQKNNSFAKGRQIVVQLSSCTRNKLEADPKVKDDDKPLLQKEYPRVRQSSIEKEENAIIEKIKASVKRFKNNNKLNGDKNVEKVFRNIQNIIKMTINYPLSLTEPSYEDEIPCRGQTCMAERHVECPVVTAPQSARTADVRLSAFQDDEECLKTAAITGGLPAQTLVDRNSLEILSSRRRKKVLEFLDSSSGEETMLHSQLKSFPKKSPKTLNSSGSSSTDDERCMISYIRGKYSSKEKESIFFNDVSYNAANTSVVEDNFVSSVPNGAFCQKIDEKKVADSSFELSSMSLHQDTKQVCVEKKVDINDNVSNMSTIASVTPRDTFNEIAERNGFNQKCCQEFSNETIPKHNEYLDFNHNTRSRTVVQDKTVGCEDEPYCNKVVDNEVLDLHESACVMNTCDSDSPELTGSALSDNKVDPRPRYIQESLLNVKNACVWPTVRRDSERLENKSKDKDLMGNNSSIRNYGKVFKTKTGKRSIAACFFGANAKNHGERNTETLAPGCAKSVESRGIKKSCDLHEIPAFEPKNEIFSSKFAQLDLDFNAKKDRLLKVPEIESPSVRKMLDFYCLQDDTEIQKLENELRDVNDAVEKVESTYKKIHLNKPKFRDIAPKERVIQLEREIRDAEILIQKKLEIWNAQSNEKELAFEKEMLHQNDDKSLLSQFSLEIKKDSLQNEISLRKCQLNVLQLKINQHNLGGNEG